MDELPWLLQELIAHWVILALTFCGALILGIARKYWESVAAPMFYAVVGGGVIFVCMWLIAQVDRQISVLEQLVGDRPTRPYFTQIKSEVQKNNKGSNDFVVAVENNNVPAENVVSHLLAVSESLDPTKEPLHTNRVENANAVGPGGKLQQSWLSVSIPPNARSLYILFQIRYTDALRGNTYSQAFVLKFLGASQDGTFNTSLYHARSDEKARILRYLKERRIPIL